MSLETKIAEYLATRIAAAESESAELSARMDAALLATGNDWENAHRTRLEVEARLAEARAIASWVEYTARMARLDVEATV